MIGVRSPRLARFRVVRGEMMPGVASFELENGEKTAIILRLGCYPEMAKAPVFYDRTIPFADATGRETSLRF